MIEVKPYTIAETFVALDDAGSAKPLPVTDNFWEALQQGKFGTFSRMISFLTFEQDWETWEKHPAGEEFVYLVEGDLELVLEQNGIATSVTLNQPETYVLVPANTWHTAKVRKPSKLLFITPGEGTEIKPK